MSMLFSMLQIACRYQSNIGEEIADLEAQSFILIAGQALLAGQYHKARPYSVEALLLYAYCKWVHEKDQEKDAWLIMGVNVRLGT